MAFLLLQPGMDTERRAEIDVDELTVGRSRENRVVINDPSVSARHCVIVRTGGKYSVRDLGSTNGTTLNGLPVRESRLKTGDALLVGNVGITFEDEDVPADVLTADPAPVRPKVGPPAPFAAFGKKKDSKGVWNVVIVVAIALSVAASALFITYLVTR